MGVFVRDRLFVRVEFALHLFLTAAAVAMDYDDQDYFVVDVVAWSRRRKKNCSLTTRVL